MACADIEGNWEKPILVTQNGDVMEDPVLSIAPKTGGGFEGTFQGDNLDPFDVRCTDHGKVSRIKFTRRHPDGKTTTEYRAVVVVVTIELPEETRKVVVSMGQFTRTTRENGRTAVLSGDWETEKPGES